MRSLRGRLTLGVTLVLAVVLAGAGVMRRRATSTTPSARRSTTSLEAHRRALARDRAGGRRARVAAGRPAPRQRPVGDAARSLRLLGRARSVLGSPAARRRPAADPARDGLQTFTAGGERLPLLRRACRLSALGGLARLRGHAAAGADRAQAVGARPAARRLRRGGAAARGARRRGSPPTSAAAPAAPPAPATSQHRRRPRTSTGACPATTGRRSCARWRRASTTMLARLRALGGRPRARAGGDAALHRRRRATSCARR